MVLRLLHEEAEARACYLLSVYDDHGHILLVNPCNGRPRGDELDELVLQTQAVTNRETAMRWLS